MDKITQEDISPQTERELTSPLSPKRPRTDSTMTLNLSGRTKFDFPELLTFWKTTGSPSSTSIGPVCTAECGDTEDEDEKPQEEQDTKLILTPITELTTSHSDDEHTGSSEACLITAERHLPPLVKDEQLLVTESDKLSSYPVGDAGGALAESHTSKDTSAEMSGHPDCKQLGESLEDKPPRGCNLTTGNGEDRGQVQSSVSQIQAFTSSLSDEEVRCRSDCTHEDRLLHTGFCNTWSQSAKVDESNQKRVKHGVNENLLFSKEKEESYSPISSSNYADMKSFYSNSKEESSGKLAEGVKNEEKILDLQIGENENVAVCEGETKVQVNENGLSRNSIPSAAECAEGSIVSYDVVLAKNVATERMNIEADCFCGAKGEHAAGKMIAKAQSETADHTTETPMSARISQEPAEGDNDAGPFSVIDPAIWSETDREAEEKCCNSQSTAGAELSPSVQVCKMEMPLSLCSDVGPSQEVSAPDQSRQFNHQSRAQQCEDEKEDFCQSYTEPQACSITTNETHNKTGSEGSCLWKSSPSSGPKPPPAGDGRQESHDTVGHQLKEQDQSGCFPVSFDDLKTQEVEYLQTEIAIMDRATQIKGKEITSFEKEVSADEEGKSEKLMDLKDRLLQQNEKHKEDTTEISTGDYISGRRADEISKYNTKLTHIDEELGNNLECWFDHLYSAVIPVMEGATEENERKEEASVGEETDVQRNSKILVTSEILVTSGDMTQESPDGSISEWTENNMSKSVNTLTQVSQHVQGNEQSCFSDNQNKAETFLVENKDDLLAPCFPATSDAVVPCPHELILLQSADNNPAALNCSDRFSPVPSAFIFCDRVPGGFDTFKKIQLSLDDDDGDGAGLSNSPLLTSLPGQLLKTPQRQLHHSMPEAETSEHEEEPEEEEVEEGEGEKEVERFQCHTENMANGFLSSDYSCNELPNFISAAVVAALEWPEQGTNSDSECFQKVSNPQSESSTVSSKSDRPALDVNDSPEFEMKKQFNMVLKELNLFFDISVNDFASDSTDSSPEQCSDVPQASEDDTLNCKEQLSSPELGHHRDTSSDDADEKRSLDMCGGDPVVSCTSGSGNGEQEVPIGSGLCQDASMNTAEKCREPQEMEQKSKMWFPSFMCRPFLEQLSHRPQEQPRRLEPLRTCSGPIRVGLSKRAKTKHLHCPHPYK